MFDFEGFVSKADTPCADGRVICQDAFADQYGTRVPLVYQHGHNDISSVIGNVYLTGKNGSLWGQASLNDTPNGKLASKQIQHGDLDSMSIYANHLQSQGNRVLHGMVREVSLVLAGANPGAKIEQINIQHDGFDEVLDDEAIIFSGATIEHTEDASTLKHAASTESAPQNSQSTSEAATDIDDDDDTVMDVWVDMDDDEKNFVINVLADYLKISIDEAANLLKDAGLPQQVIKLSQEQLTEIYNGMDDDEQRIVAYIIGGFAEQMQSAPDNSTDSSVTHDAFSEGDNMSHYNVFEQGKSESDPVIAHDALNGLLGRAISSHVSSLHDLFDDALVNGGFTDTNGNTIEHDDVNRTHTLNYGIQDVEYLFPDARTRQSEPTAVARDTEWVTDFMGGVDRAPFSRVKSNFVDITADEARAKGYTTGKKKIESVMKALHRVTTPQTVYEKQKLDRDDVLDITDFSVVEFLKNKMSILLREDVARAALVGDGRTEMDEQKIHTEHIRPIYGDDSLYTIYTAATDADLEYEDSLCDMAIIAREEYRGSGSPVLYATNHMITSLLLSRNKMGARNYHNETELAAALRVSRIVEVPVFERVTRTNGGATMGLLGIIVNPRDYTFGMDKGGEETFFDDFDIDFNQYKYLAETRVSGALNLPKAAIALEYDTSKYTFNRSRFAKKTPGAAPTPGH